MLKYENLKLVKNRIDKHPFPYIVYSYEDFFNTGKAPVFIEAWQSREEAMHCAQYRQDCGFVVTVFKELAHSQNWSKSNA